MDNQAENQAQEPQQEQAVVYVKGFSGQLIKSLETQQAQQVNLILRQYKLQNGAPNFPAIFAIPSHERLVALSQLDHSRLNVVIICALTAAFELMNIKRGFNELQILELAEAIIDSAGEDNLALEDLVLFLQQMVRGKYEMSYESFDGTKFMRMFEQYRQERYEAVLEARENRHCEFKALGDPTRSTKPETAFEEHLQQYSQKLRAKNDELKLLRRESKQKGNV